MPGDHLPKEWEYTCQVGSDLSGGSDNLGFGGGLLHGFVRGTLDDTAGYGEGGIAVEEGVDVAGGHASFVDAPEILLVVEFTSRFT